jgi:hypothetical protein
MITHGTVTHNSSLACQDPLFVCGMVTIPQLSIDRNHSRAAFLPEAPFKRLDDQIGFTITGVTNENNFEEKTTVIVVHCGY